MNKKYCIKLFCFLIMFFFSLGCFGQKLYTFNKWKNSYRSEQNKVIFQIDTTDSKNDLETLLVSKIIQENLIANGVEVLFKFLPTDSIIDENILCLRFTALDRAYVVTGALQSEIPLCVRVKIIQVEPELKKSINADVAIAVDNYANNLEAFGIEFSKNLLKHFNVTKPYKEFRLD